ncbi:MAG: hypothetical protein J7K51_10215 [Thermotogae bacterium]|nr:hypothetical protein [Thermotogota bacterium]
MLLYDEPVLTKYIDITLGMGWEDVNLIKKVIEDLIICKIAAGRARDIEDIRRSC